MDQASRTKPDTRNKSTKKVTRKKDRKRRSPSKPGKQPRGSVERQSSIEKAEKKIERDNSHKKINIKRNKSPSSMTSSVREQYHQIEKPDRDSSKRQHRSRERAENSREKTAGGRLRTNHSPTQNIRIALPTSPSKDHRADPHTANTRNDCQRPDAHRAHSPKILFEHKSFDQPHQRDLRRNKSITPEKSDPRPAHLYTDLLHEQKINLPRSAKASQKSKSKRVANHSIRSDVDNATQIRKKVFREFKTKLLGSVRPFPTLKNEEKKPKKKTQATSSHAQKCKHINLEFLVSNLKRLGPDRFSQSDASLMNAKTADESQKATLRLNPKQAQGRFLKKKNTTTKKKSSGPANVAVTKKQREPKAISSQSIQVVDMVSNGIKSSASSVRLEDDKADLDRSASDISNHIIQQERAAIEIQKRWRGLKARKRLQAATSTPQGTKKYQTTASKAPKTSSSNRIIPRIPAIKVINQSDIEPVEPLQQSKTSLGRHQEDAMMKESIEMLQKQSDRILPVADPPSDSLMSIH